MTKERAIKNQNTFINLANGLPIAKECVKGISNHIYVNFSDISVASVYFLPIEKLKDPYYIGDDIAQLIFAFSSKDRYGNKRLSISLRQNLELHYYLHAGNYHHRGLKDFNDIGFNEILNSIKMTHDPYVGEYIHNDKRRRS